MGISEPQPEVKNDVPDVTGRTLNMTRPVYTLDDYNNAYHTQKHKKSLSDRIEAAVTARNVKKALFSFLPIVKVIRKYDFRSHLTGDILAGLTVTFMHLPQGMAFGLLSSLRPIYGLYTTFFPVILYTIFGTCPFISFGTNAVMALLTQTVVEREADVFIAGYSGVRPTNTSNNTTNTGPSDSEILQVKVETAMLLSVFSGILLIVMGTLKLGFLTSYLSTSFIGGFTTAAAVHITSSQIPKVFGIKTQSYAGAGKLVLLYIDLFRKITQTNLADLIIAVISFGILIAVKVGINERYKQKMKIPIPIDLILVVIATTISYFTKLEDNFDVEIVGSIPSGFTAPYVPNLNRATNLITDSVIIGILSLALTITMAKLTSTKQGVNIDDSQEIFAYGMSTFVSGFFGCFPSATAPPRTMLLVSLGARTTLHAVPTALVFVLIILIIGTLFQTLPIAVLAAMIIVSMKDLLLQYTNLKHIWRVNKFDFIIWVITNASSVLIDLDYGLIIGVGVSILLVVVQSQTVSGYMVTRASHDDILYVTDTCSRNDVKIFTFPTNLYFATAERFKRQIFSQVFNPQTYTKTLERARKNKKTELSGFVNDTFDGSQTEKNGKSSINEHNSSINGPNPVGNNAGTVKPNTVIIDCSRIQYIDMAGINILSEVTREYTKLGVKVYLTAVCKSADTALNNAGFYQTFARDHVYLDVFDVLEMLKQEYVYHL